VDEAALFIGVFVGLFLARLVLATVFFVLILPDDDRCPMCNAVTEPVESRWRWLTPKLRASWCLRCGWEGLLRQSARSPVRFGEKPGRKPVHH